MELQQHVFHPLLNASPLAEEYHGVRGQVIRATGGVRADEIQIAIQTGDSGAVPEPLRIRPEGLGGIVAAVLPGVFARQHFQLLRKTGRAAGSQLRQKLRRRKEQGGGHVFRPPLGAGVEPPQRVDFIVKEFAPHRLLHQGGEHIQNTAPQSELAHALHLIAAAIPRL